RPTRCGRACGGRRRIRRAEHSQTRPPGRNQAAVTRPRSARRTRRPARDLRCRAAARTRPYTQHAVRPPGCSPRPGSGACTRSRGIAPPARKRKERTAGREHLVASPPEVPRTPLPADLDVGYRAPTVLYERRETFLAEPGGLPVGSQLAAKGAAGVGDRARVHHASRAF